MEKSGYNNNITLITNQIGPFLKKNFTVLYISIYPNILKSPEIGLKWWLDVRDEVDDLNWLMRKRTIDYLSVILLNIDPCVKVPFYHQMHQVCFNLWTYYMRQ